MANVEPAKHGRKFPVQVDHARNRRHPIRCKKLAQKAIADWSVGLSVVSHGLKIKRNCKHRHKMKGQKTECKSYTV